MLYTSSEGEDISIQLNEMDAVAIDGQLCSISSRWLRLQLREFEGFWTLQLNSHSIYDEELKGDHSCIKYFC